MMLLFYFQQMSKCTGDFTYNNDPQIHSTHRTDIHERRAIHLRLYSHLATATPITLIFPASWCKLRFIYTGD